MVDEAASQNGTSDADITSGDHVNTIDGLAEAVRGITSPQDERRMIFARGENYRHIRHAQIMERWPIIAEPWARRIEMRRVAIDRTPGAATFGR